MAISAAEAANRPRAGFRVFGRGIIGVVREKMWNAGAVLWKAEDAGRDVFPLCALG
jgi:hypothetical protein